MLANRKRAFGKAGAIFALISAIQLLFWDLLLVIDNLVGKITGSGFLNEILSGFEIDFGIAHGKHYAETSIIYEEFSFMYAVMFFIGIFIIISAVKYFRDPIVDGKVKYMGKLEILTILINIAMCVLLFLGKDKVQYLISGDLFPLLCWEMMACAFISIICYIISLLCKKNRYIVEEVVEKQEKQKPDIDTMYSYEKVKRVKQMQALGVLNQTQSDDNVSKFSRGA